VRNDWGTRRTVEVGLATNEPQTVPATG
jgi:hypothetical protein